ncbi:MalY/PatB family protein [Liquorilactobacillus capillatus]|uniref:cysteine-S-conjugate beta-lyase n=1 Tax=Liquorilactobacillus capillatus DSM 19910 TaxID=1423731 RepID=A0A0R1LZA7_9LACO|nr:MalY/PatB family protein [Liquorilactobacillus capillatus]KRL00919.1 aminotransferase [Liquorilactobacillus capillatus DSM 19910]
MNVDEFVKRYATDRHNTDSVKWDGMDELFGTNDLLPLWVADTEFKAPEVVIEALEKRIQHGVYGYSKTPDSYYESYCKWQKERYGTDIQREWMRFGTGVVQSLSTLVNILTQPGDAVMILQPVYYPFMNVINQNERQLVVSELKPKGTSYEMDLDDIKQKIEENHVKLFINCSPHNPVGRVWSSAELEGLLALCRQEKVLFISDEIHHDLIVGERPFISALSIKDGLYRDNMVMLDSASKTFNLAGLQNSHVTIPNPQVRERYDLYTARLAAPAGNIIGKVAGEAAYSGGAEWLEGLLNVIRSNYTYLKEELQHKCPQAVVYDLEGTYLAWVDLSAVIEPEHLEYIIKKKAHLAVDFGTMFGAAGKGFIRINLATTPANIKTATAAIIAQTNC